MINYIKVKNYALAAFVGPGKHVYPALTSHPLTSRFINTELDDCDVFCVLKEHFKFNFESFNNCSLSVTIDWSFIRIFALENDSCFCKCNCDVPINCCNNSGVVTIELAEDPPDDGLERLWLGSGSITRLGRLLGDCFEVSTFPAVIVRDEGRADNLNVVVWGSIVLSALESLSKAMQEIIKK